MPWVSKSLSIVIISKNEENYIGQLLQSIFKQELSIPFEVIVADAGSEDATVAIARGYNVRIVKGGLPATGRNSGARAAKGNILLFLDADVELPDGFLKKNMDEFFRRHLDIATVYAISRSPKMHYQYTYRFSNLWFSIAAKSNITPYVYGFCIFCRTSFHNRISGFNESIRMGEDLDYISRAYKHGRFGVLRSVPIVASTRRFEKEGLVPYASKLILHGILRMIVGGKKADIFSYDFYYSKKKT